MTKGQTTDPSEEERLATHLATLGRLGIPSPESETETVPFPGGFRARRYFTRKVLRWLPDHTPVGITMTMTAHDGGKTSEHRIVISDEGFEAIGDDQLVEIGAKLIEARDEILRVELQEMTPNRGYTPEEASTAAPEDFEGIVARDAAAAGKSARTARRRRQVTPELLAKVLDLYEQDGISAVTAALDYSESYGFKLLRKAREEQARDRKKVQA